MERKIKELIKIIMKAIALSTAISCLLIISIANTLKYFFGYWPYDGFTMLMYHEYIIEIPLIIFATSFLIYEYGNFLFNLKLKLIKDNNPIKIRKFEQD